MTVNMAKELAAHRVVPVITPVDIPSTVALADALAAGGMSCIEITLRADCALDAIRAVKTSVAGLRVAAGTITQPAAMEAALDAGADFLVSPGISVGLLQQAASMDAPLLPGVATASEVMLGLDHGMACFKLFPAHALGGLALLKSLGGPFPQVRFCPTGGLSAGNFRQYLAQPNVVCCGGSWMVTPELVAARRWDEVRALAAAALAA